MSLNNGISLTELIESAGGEICVEIHFNTPLFDAIFFFSMLWPIFFRLEIVKTATAKRRHICCSDMFFHISRNIPSQNNSCDSTTSLLGKTNLRTKDLQKLLPESR